MSIFNTLVRSTGVALRSLCGGEVIRIFILQWR